MTPHPRRRASALAPLLAAVALAALASGCSTGSAGDASSDSGAAGSRAGGSSLASVDQSAPRQEADAAADTALTPSTAPATISTGTVALRSRDVGALLADVQLAVDQVRGEVSERSSETDDDGEVVRSRLVVRVPASSFGELMGALEDAGTLVSSDSTSEDVTAQVIDTGVRVSAQRASITRVRALLAEATDLDDVVAIEAQLTERQAALDSLEQTQAFLADQTSRSTITVSLRRSTAPTAPREADATGFLAGLSSGWHALAVAGGGAATVAGALLPWLLAAGLAGAPVVVAARRLRRRTTGETAPSA